MPRVINLTLPLYDHMPVGNVWAWDMPFQMEDITNYEIHGMRKHACKVDSEVGTRFIMKSIYNPDEALIGKLDFSLLINRDTVVIDIPKGAEEEINAKDISEKVEGDSEYRDGDVVLIRTGWGDNERFREMGDEYAIRTPHFSDDGAEKFAEVLRRKGSDLFAIDVAYIGNCGRHYMMKEWVKLPPWQRPPYPSDAAKAYLRNYTREKVVADWTTSEVLHRVAYTIIACCNCGSISRKRVKLAALPLFIEQGVSSTITVVAVED